MRVVIAREQLDTERRVAGTPDTVTRLVRLGFEVAVQAGAGAPAGFSDEAYAAAGAELVPDCWGRGDVLVRIHAIDLADVPRLSPGSLLVSVVRPAQNPELLAALAARGVTTIALDCVPRISRAQKMDVLSSMANIAGYRAVVEAAHAFGRFFNGQITAAGKTPPATVLVIGAGVAGLAAIATARGLGAEVRAFDVRAAAREQVQSLGAGFLTVELDESGDGGGGYAREMSPAFVAAEHDLLRAQCREVDVVIATALIPGRAAPKLILTDMVSLLRPGSVIVDLAAEAGGNCEDTVPGQVVVRDGVTIVGFTDMTSRLPTHASQFFGTNVAHLLDELGGGSALRIDMDNDAVRGAVVTHAGAITWPPPPIDAAPARASTPRTEPRSAGAPAAFEAPPHVRAHATIAHGAPRGGAPTWVTLAATAALLLLGGFAPSDFIAHLTVFLLAVFVGWQLIWSVTPALHTPLMSVTNAVSGIIVVGGILQLADPARSPAVAAVAAVAILVAAINIAGGFYVTQRMLQMFRKDR